MASNTVEVEEDGRTLRLSNLDKVLYPEAGFTKGDVIAYYERVAPRCCCRTCRAAPLTMKRYPNGVDEQFFFQKRRPQAPARLGAAPSRSGRAATAATSTS